MSFILDYIERTIKGMGYSGYTYEVITIEKEKDTLKTEIQAYNDYYFLNSYFFPAGTESLKFSIWSDNAFDEFVHQESYSGLSDLKLTHFYTGLIVLETYKKSRTKSTGGNINSTTFLFNFIRVTPYI